MRHRPEYVERSGSPDRSTGVRARRLWLTVAASGVAICVAAGVALATPAPGPAPRTAAAPAMPTRPPESTTSGDHRTEASVTSAESPVTSAAPGPASESLTGTTTTSAPLADVPVALRLADADSPITIVPIGVSPDGILDPPADVTTAGWWVAGPRPGGPGRTVITGHIDSRTAGIGAFAALDALNPGDRLSLTTVDGRTIDYVVTARDEIAKTELDPAVLAGSATSDLLLVTCIGVFDTDTRSYESNLLITAVPVDG